MSLFSRWFGKGSSSSPAVAPKQQTTATARPKPSADDRARANEAEEKALQSALDARDIQAVARFVTAGSSNKVRQAAAQAIDDPELLRQLIRDVRGGNDKNVYKILTARRDVQLEQARQREQLQTEIDAASAALERHSQRAYDELFGLRLEQFETRWNAVAAQADEALRGRTRQWIDRARETQAEQQRQIAEQAARQQAAAEAKAAAAAETRRLREQQAQIAAEAAAAVEPAAPVEEAEPMLSDEQLAEQEARQAVVRQIGELIRKARAALGAGGTARAAGVRQTIEEKLAAAAPLPAVLSGQLQQLDRQLDELKDWKDFSVAPKRVELIEEMESLVDAVLEPQALADRIQGLKDEWRTLGKGAGENVEADAQRFQAAAQKAFEPCKAYFAEQALIRKENLQKRDALLARLAAFNAAQDWERPDWRTLIKTLREAKQEWRGHVPVDHKAGRSQQAAFSALVGSLQERLDAEYARNLQQKESLIARAQALLASDDGRKAIDAIKDLQQKWQAVGPLPREADQRLWEAFRRHTDALFQKRQQESAAYTAGLDSNKAQAIALCEQVEQIAALDGSEVQARATALGELRQAFAALGEFPRADARELRNRFERGLERCAKAVARQQARDAERSWHDLFEAAQPVRAYRLAAARGAAQDQLDALRATAEARIAAVQRWPKQGLETLKAQLRQELARERAADPAANAAALKLLCIRAEMLADLPTPAEDQALRREYQLQRLVQGMGQGVRAEDAHLDALALEWLAAGPVDDGVYEPLLQRFLRCREAGSSRSA